MPTAELYHLPEERGLAAEGTDLNQMSDCLLDSPPIRMSCLASIPSHLPNLIFILRREQFLCMKDVCLFRNLLWWKPPASPNSVLLQPARPHIRAGCFSSEISLILSGQCTLLFSSAYLHKVLCALSLYIPFFHAHAEILSLPTRTASSALNIRIDQTMLFYPC